MILLALESAGLYSNLAELSTGALYVFLLQFKHHPWHGLRFWDLIQPGFMFIAGTSMAFSLYRQQEQGFTWLESLKKTARRSCWLFFWGVLDYAVRPSGLSFELWDVLTQLAFTTFIAFLIFNWRIYFQLAFCILILILTEALYRYTNVPGFDQPFVNQHNFGNYMDILLMNKINKGGWVAINCIPTAVHTILGALAGKLLLNQNKSCKSRIFIMLIGAIVCLISGYALDIAGITPIIKRIATSSFTLVSAGWCFIGLAICYWIIDCLKRNKKLLFFTVVGYNSLFVYLFFEIVGNRWFNEYLAVITNGLMSIVNTPQSIQLILTPLCILFSYWGLCYFLYTKRIFFKL